MAPAPEVARLPEPGQASQAPPVALADDPVEPRHVAAVERFVEEGWLPDPSLAGTLGLEAACA